MEHTRLGFADHHKVAMGVAKSVAYVILNISDAAASTMEKDESTSFRSLCLGIESFIDVLYNFNLSFPAVQRCLFLGDPGELPVSIRFLREMFSR